ncbi:RnfABCDGE type electron transport complex subunit D [Treponema pectinovorum]|uniref:RnfABCDGE type electron transport complex subunit D n=1 Tax=Treponema pectinovorum TaxID=164 RepID=UPI0011F1FD5B|nr:RnfABCDGE type electron transport complex subunit D [Treponema pectinovorum]
MKNKIEITSRPYKYLSFSVKTNSIVILSFLTLQVLLLFFTRSWANLILIFSTTFATCAVELIEFFNRDKKNCYNFITAAIQGILTGLFLPSTFPFYAAFFATFFVFFSCRFFIARYADNWINLPALTVALCWILGETLFPSFELSSEILFSKNPSLFLIQNGTFPMIDADPKITSFLNKTVFSLFGVSIPDGYVSLFWDTHSTIAAFRFNFITLISSLILFSFDVIKILIPGIFVLTYAILIYFILPLFYASPTHGDLFLAFCTSGFLMACLFLLQMAGTTPMTNLGKSLYAVIAGICAFLIVGAGTSPSGIVFTILFMNAVSPLIQYAEYFFEIKRVKKQLQENSAQLKDGNNA